MSWLRNPYVVSLLLAAAVAIACALFAWRRRPTAGAAVLAILMLLVAQWTLGYALELASAGLAAKLFWAKIQYLGIVAVPVMWLAFALQYAGKERWLIPRNMALLAVVPAVTLLMVWTNETHGLIWSSVELDTSGRFSILELTHGWGFLANIGSAYIWLILGSALLLQALVRSPHLYRRQAVILLVGVSAPWIGNVLYISGMSPVPNLDLTPFGFTISGIALIWGRFRFQLLDILPVARDTIVESMRDGVIVLDVQDRIVDLNPPAQGITGQTSLDIIGQPVGVLLPDWPNMPVPISSTETVSSEVLFGEGEAQRLNDLQISPLRDWRGRYQGRLIVLRDVTDRRKAEKALHERTRQLELANKELEAFSYSVSHDLRAPLRTIDGFSQILLEEHVDSLDALGQGHLLRVRAASQRMGQLIDSLLKLSRTTQADIYLEAVAMSGLARDINTVLQALNPGREVELVIEEGVDAEGDMRLLRIVLENLLGNAWKYTSNHSRAKIEFGATRLKGEVVYFVRDDGAGFNPAYTDRLFGTFQRLHSEDEFKGDGIGLATVQRIIHRHGGRVWAEGAVEQGATFYFTLGTTLASRPAGQPSSKSGALKPDG